MTTNKLQLNDTKTEAMIALSNRMSIHTSLPAGIYIEDTDVPFVSSVKNLGITPDSNISMPQHINNTCKTACIQVRHISSIRHLRTTQATQTLVCSLVLSRLDYVTPYFQVALNNCQANFKKFRTLQHGLYVKSDHIQPILQSLHWLLVTHRIQYNISTICFNSLSSKAPQYLPDHTQAYTPTRKLRSASDSRTFVIPRVNTKLFGERSFSYLSGTICLGQSITLILHHSKPL